MRIVKTRGEISGFESRVYRKNGDVIWISENARAVFDDEGRVLHYEGTVEDITERRQNQARIEQQANYDSLTGLANRSLLNDRLQQAIYTAASYGARLAVVFVDLDRFKYINDTLGHDVGDRLLQVMAERFTSAVAETDTVARLGGDEFVLLLHGQAGPDTVATVLERLLPTISAPLRYGQSDLEVTCSIGVALYPDDGSDPATLLKHADSAMYRAKEQGRNNFQFFTEELNRAIKERFDLESQLRRALERGQFELHYQPRVDMTSRKIIGAEALIRWHVPGRGMVSPATFIPVAEEIGLIGPISEWVLETACAQNKRWHDAGLPCVVSVNISPQQFRGDGLVPLIARRPERNAAWTRGCLEIEITESTVMHAGERMVEMLHAIKKLGVHIAVDDFGTGYSSLSYLKRFPVDRLKVDRSFVQHIADADDAVIVRAIIALGHNLGLKVVAEGVETEEQIEFLRANGCDELQGYYFSKPVSAWQMTKLLANAVNASAAQDRPPARDVQQALQRDGDVGKGRRRQQAARTRQILGPNHAVLLHERQRAHEARVELGRQRQEVDDDAGAEREQAAREADQAEIRRARQRAGERREHQHAGADLLDRRHPMHEPRSPVQRAEAARVLQRMADLVRGDRDGRQRAAVEVVGREAHDLRERVVVVAVLRDLRRRRCAARARRASDARFGRPCADSGWPALGSGA